MKGKYYQQPKCVACSYGVGSHLGAKLQSFMFSSLSSSDRIIPNLDTLVPFDSTKAYDILDVIYPVSGCDQSIIDIILLQNARVLQLFAFHCQISPSHPTPPCSFQSQSFLSSVMTTKHTAYRQSGIKVKFFYVEHRGKVEISQQHNLPFGSIRRNIFPFLLYSQSRNSGNLKCYTLCTFVTTNFIVKQYQHVWVSVYTRDYHSDL